MPLGPVIGDSAVPLQPDVAVRINQARHEPDLGGDRLRVGDRLSTDHRRLPRGRDTRPQAAPHRPGAGVGPRWLTCRSGCAARWQLEVGHGFLEGSLVEVATTKCGRRVNRCSRLLGRVALGRLPETPDHPLLLGSGRLPSRPVKPPMPGTPGIVPVASELIILRASKKRLMRVLTSETSTPLPGDPGTSGAVDDLGVLALVRRLEWMIASM